MSGLNIDKEEMSLIVVVPIVIGFFGLPLLGWKVFIMTLPVIPIMMVLIHAANNSADELALDFEK